jgi:hypothetical protein
MLVEADGGNIISLISNPTKGFKDADETKARYLCRVPKRISILSLTIIITTPGTVDIHGQMIRTSGDRVFVRTEATPSNQTEIAGVRVGSRR